MNSNYAHIRTKENFKAYGCSAMMWYQYALFLKNDADVLKDQAIKSIDILYNMSSDDKEALNAFFNISTGHSNLALYGYSIECLLKGIYYHDFSEKLDKGEIDKSLSNHNLASLAKAAKIDFLDEGVLKLLSDEISAFRYPIPMYVTEKVIYQTGVPSNLYEKINETFNELSEKLRICSKTGVEHW